VNARVKIREDAEGRRPMTEAEWSAGTERHTLIRYLFFDTVTSDRKLRLFSVACCYPILPHLRHLAPHAAHLLALTEAFADRLIPPAELTRPRAEFYDRWERFTAEADTSVEADLDLWVIGMSGIQAVLGSTLCAEESFRPDTQYRQRGFYPRWPARPFPCAAAGEAAAAFVDATDRREEASAAAADHQRRLLFDIFGNPFRPVTLDPAWRTSTAVALAQQMYESRDFAAMPILADALQHAGCEDEQILAHCRGPGLHVRGCWVVDAVFGKE
jgi:hypothetical protein